MKLCQTKKGHTLGCKHVSSINGEWGLEVSEWKCCRWGSPVFDEEERGELGVGGVSAVEDVHCISICQAIWWKRNSQQARCIFINVTDYHRSPQLPNCLCSQMGVKIVWRVWCRCQGDLDISLCHRAMLAVRTKQSGQSLHSCIQLGLFPVTFEGGTSATFL